MIDQGGDHAAGAAPVGIKVEKDCFSTAPDSNQNFDQILIDKRNDLIQITFAQNHRASPHILILAYNYCCVNSIVLFY